MAIGSIAQKERTRIVEIQRWRGDPAKCSHCQNFSPLWAVRLYVEGYEKLFAFGKEIERRQNYYKTILCCQPCKEKVERLAQ